MIMVKMVIHYLKVGCECLALYLKPASLISNTNVSVPYYYIGVGSKVSILYWRSFQLAREMIYIHIFFIPNEG